MAGQDLIAKVRVETGPAEEQLKAFLGKTRTLTVNVKANTSAIEKSVGALKSVESAGKAAQEAVSGSNKKKQPTIYEDALKSATKLEKAYQKLADRQTKLKAALTSGTDNGTLKAADADKYQKQLQAIESKLRQIEVAKKALNQASGMNAKDIKESISYANSLDLQSSSMAANADRLIKQNQQVAKSYTQIQKDAEKSQNKIIGFDKIGNRLNEYYSKYGNQIQKNIGLYNQFMTLMNKAQNGGFASVQEANRAFAQFRMQCRGAGVEVESIGSKLERTFGARVRSALAGQGVYMIQRSVQEILSNALEFDKAFTELKKVTNATDARYTQFVEDAKTRAVDLKTSLSDVVSSAADFARLGYDIPQAEEVSKAAIVYSRVGDGVKDIDQASSSLISTMQAFKIPASDVMTIVDKQHCPLKIA